MDLQCWGKAGAGLTWTPQCDPEEPRWVGLQREHAHIRDHRSHLQQWWTEREAREDSTEDRQCVRQKISRESSVSPHLYQSLSLHTERSPLAGQQWKPFSRCRRSESTVTVLQNSLDKGVPDILVCSVLWPYREVQWFWFTEMHPQYRNNTATCWLALTFQSAGTSKLYPLGEGFQIGTKQLKLLWRIQQVWEESSKASLLQSASQDTPTNEGKAPRAATVEGSWQDWMEKRSEGCCGMAVHVSKDKTKCHWAASGRTRKSDKPAGDPRNRPPIVWAASEQTRHCSPQAENWFIRNTKTCCTE